MPAHAAALCQLGVDAVTALALAARYSPERVGAVVRAAPRRASRNPAGWAIRALERGWAVNELPTPAAAPGWQQPPEPSVTEGADAEVEACWQGWDRAVSAVLDDAQLARAARLACAGMPAGARVGPAVRAHLIRWAAHTFHVAGTDDLRASLHAALDDQASPTQMALDDTMLPHPPDVEPAAPPLRERLTALGPIPGHPSRRERGLP